jgi:hypothetical protein
LRGWEEKPERIREQCSGREGMAKEGLQLRRVATAAARHAVSLELSVEEENEEEKSEKDS